ncbi:tRNA (adenosine(37)-N6)-threonylcarbamoyltransferase complex dimerization subunit type 1 TsaB [Aequorivita echinoideorum]|uniref:tRNA (Adenosine(37)-N6)-threonylcarbamoyltransferase complex dimerization subunit type 1 TsaB n=1 Tax=Aequorivita echinoideorum TaxID=1549647 RepID=A0ABS5S5K4_9FLAO|nr:tRNA (adenosine(37)-N6)-threonylcarbamoyltransferase complex dimerization subunit type 1 TsaB [Aequorivita echinoideorum]MBT0607695.1 tRNA (adenosine(37)-N6)-threonylcarbamoyltransferase complex dimerization subunit type 1 TsaB [Aequorivita echinoideorum]
MATILSLETSTTNCSVALAIDGKNVAWKENNDLKYSHAEKLHVFIEEVLKDASVDFGNLDAIAVGKGPGSYTGLRIGVSAAKGLCFSLDIPLLAISTLEILAIQAKAESGIVIPMLDARRMEVYTSVFSSEMKLIRETKAEILSETSYLEYLNTGKVIFLGDGAKKFKQICAHKNAVFLENKYPSAKDMDSISETMYKNSDTVDVAYFEPYYLKDFVLGK